MRSSIVAIFALSLLLSSCNNDGGMQFVDIGTSPAGGVFNPVGTALAETLNENKGDNNWKAQAKGTKGSQENIKLLQDGELQLAISNAAISYFAVQGGADWDEKYGIRTIATIAPNVAMFITTEESGIKTIQDLKGKRVVCGPAGAGFDMFIEPIIKAHGVEFADFEKQLYNVPNGAVEMLQDGQADAAFLGGALPTPIVQRACRDMNVHFIPFDVDAVEQILKDYPFYAKITVAKDRYEDLTEDYQGLNVGSMHLITHASMDEDTIYQITKTIYENRESIGHPAAKKFINETNAPRNTGTPFHPGAIKFYKEAGIWPESTAD